MTLAQKIWLAGLFLAITVFFIGMHSIDNAWNMKFVEMQGGDWKDCALIGCYKAEVLYGLGVVMTFFGCYLLFIIALFFPHGSEKRV